VSGELKPRQNVTLAIRRRDGGTQKVTLTLRVDTPIEAEYLRHGGILPYVLREILEAA
jgi:aconitate hydratase